MTTTHHLSAYLLSVVVGFTAVPFFRVSAQSPDSSRARHPRTCVKGLKEYKQLSDVPSAFEILRLEIPPTPVDPSGFRTFMLDQFAEHGATGFVAQPPQTTGEQTFFGFVPLYVSADSARVAMACRPSAGERGARRSEHSKQRTARRPIWHACSRARRRRMTAGRHRSEYLVGDGFPARYQRRRSH